ncbi:hypothetical protein [Salmon gill poxvirus]
MDKAISSILCNVSNCLEKYGEEFWKCPCVVGTDLLVDCETIKELLDTVMHYNLLYNPYGTTNTFSSQIILDRYVHPSEQKITFCQEKDKSLVEWLLNENAYGFVDNTFADELESYSTLRWTIDEVMKRHHLDHPSDVDMSDLVSCGKHQKQKISNQNILELVLNKLFYVSKILHLPVFDDVIFHGFRFDISNYINHQSRRGTVSWNPGKTSDSVVLPVPFKHRSCNIIECLRVDYLTCFNAVTMSREPDRVWTGSMLSLCTVEKNDFDFDVPTLLSTLHYVCLNNVWPESLTSPDWKITYVINMLLSWLNLSREFLVNIIWPNHKLIKCTMEESGFKIEYTDSKLTCFDVSETNDLPTSVICTLSDLTYVKRFLVKWHRLTPSKANNPVIDQKHVKVKMSLDMFKMMIPDSSIIFEPHSFVMNDLCNSYSVLVPFKKKDTKRSYSLWDELEMMVEYKFILETTDCDIYCTMVKNKYNTKSYYISKDNMLWKIYGVEPVV